MDAEVVGFKVQTTTVSWRSGRTAWPRGVRALPSPPRREPRRGDEDRADTSTPTLALTLLSFTLALAGFTEAENGGAIAAAARPVLVQAHRRTTVLQIPSTAPPASPPPPPTVA
jgi:hypothetical protein